MKNNKKVLIGILGVIVIVSLFFFVRFLGASALERNMNGNWYYAIDNWCSVFNISNNELQIESDDELYEVEYVDWNTFRVWHDGYTGIDGDYVDDYYDEFTVKFNDDKTELNISPPINYEGERGIWHKGVPSEELLNNIARNQAREEAEEIAKEQKFLQEVYSDPARHKGDLAITGVSGRLGSYKGAHHAIYFTGRIYNRSNQTIRNIEISCRSSKYSSGATAYIDSAAPNTYTDFECYSLVPYANDDDTDYFAKATIIGYDE